MKPELVKPWKWETRHGTARVVSTAKHIRRAEQLLVERKDSGILIDTETTGLERDRKLRLIQLGWGRICWIVDPYSVAGKRLAKPIQDAVWIAHNAPFDLVSFGNWRHGERNAAATHTWMLDKALAGRVHDTMIAEQVSQCHPYYSSLSKLAAEEGVANTYEDAWNDNAEKLGYTSDNKYRAVSSNNKAWLRYCAHDIFQLRAVYRRVKPELDEQLVKDETLCHVMYAILGHRGMCVHFGMASELYNELADKRLQIREKLAPLGIHSENIHAQIRNTLLRLGVKLTETTPTGQYSVRKGILEAIDYPKKARKVVGQILKARSLTKDMGTVQNLAGHSDGTRVYPDIKVIGARTGRSSCAAPNLQQLNKHSGDPRVRGLLMADWGHVLGSVDYDGIELRTIAELSADKSLRKKLLGGADIHGELAEQIYGPGYSPKERNAAKTGIFAMLYGAGDNAIHAQAGMETVEEAQALRAAWRESYPQAAKASDRWTEEADLTGQTVLPNGWSPAMGTDSQGRVAAYRAVNYNVQGMAAFIFRQGAIQLARAGLWDYVRMVVHDEFACSLPEDRAEETLAVIQTTAEVRRGKMTYTTKGELYGRHWGLESQDN